MNKLIISLFILIGSTVVNAGDFKLTKEEFLQKLNSDQISLRKDPMLVFPENLKQKMFDKIRETYPTFKDAYWYVPSLRTNKYLYTIHFDWVNKKCVFRSEELDTKTKEVLKDKIDMKGQDVDIKYCEKAYGIKIY